MLVEMLVSSAGMGDVLNPTAGTSLDCGLFAGGVFKPECWCLSYPSLCSSDDYKAAYALAHPDVYETVQQAPGVPAVEGATSSTQLTTSEYDSQVADAWTQWKTQVDTQNSDTMNQTASNLDSVSVPTTTSIPTWIWVALAGIGAFALVAIGGGSPARYGR